MTAITIQVSEEECRRIGKIAESAGVSKEKLIETALRDLISVPDDDFDQLAKAIVAKNHSLYQALS